MELYFDGASKGNPGTSGSGWYIKYNGTEIKGCKYLGIATNNQAEYRGLIEGLRIANKEIELGNNVEIIQVYGDSKLVIEQMKGNWQVKSDKLKPLYAEALEIYKEMSKKTKIEFFWIRRHLNKEADSMANQAITV